MVRSAVVLFLFLGVALAGCSDAPTSEATDGTANSEEITGLEAPTWHVGMSWTFDYGTHEERLVVTELLEDGGYVVDTTEDRSAFMEGAFGGPILGVYGADLAHETPGGMVSWFDWPLEDGKSWQVTWFGKGYRVTAQDMGDHWHMVSMDGATKANEFRYSEAMGFYEGYVWYDENGEVDSSMEATRDPDFDEDVVRAEVTNKVDLSGTGSYREPATGLALSDATEDSDLWGHIGVSCEEGPRVFMGIGSVETVVGQDPGDEGYIIDSDCPHDEMFFDVVIDQPDMAQDRALGYGYTIDVESDDAEWVLAGWLANYERIQVTPEPPAE